jgi:hypothetical protein
MILRKSIIIFFVFILLYKNLAADELVPSIRLGYDNYGDVNLHHVESDDRTGDMSKGWANFLKNLYFKGISNPNYFFWGFGWNTRYSFKNFELNQQRVNLPKNTSKQGNHMYSKIGDLGSSVKGTMIYFIPSVFYHFFRDSSINLIVGIGPLGLSYFNFKGDIYLTDSYGHIPSNQACYDYIKDNDNYENIDNYCEKIELEKNKISPVSQGYLEFLFGNFGLDFGFVTSWWERNSEGKFVGTRIQHVNMALFYQFEF